MRAFFSAVLFILAGLAPALAAAKPEEPAMRVVVVRSNENGCEPACSSWISAEGQITRATPALFRAALRSLGKTKAPVMILSGGGDVDSALAIGRMIRERKLDIIVGHTRIDPCPQGSKTCDEKMGRGLTGRPIGFQSYCASACAFVFAAGTRRIVPMGGYVGVHQIVSILTLVRHQQTFSVRRRLVQGVPVEVSRHLVKDRVVSSSTRKVPGQEAVYLRVARYFKEMGISDEINPLMRSAPPESMHWLTIAELDRTGMRTDTVEAFQVVEMANIVLKGALAPQKTTPTPVATTLVTQPVSAPLPGASAPVPGAFAPGGGGTVTPITVKTVPVILGAPPPTPAPAAVPPPVALTGPAELTAAGVVDAGRFLDKDIALMLRFKWMRGGGSLAVVATAMGPPQVQGITLGPVEFNVTLRPGTARERALIPPSFGSSPALQGYMTRAEFCQLRRDPLLKLAVLPGRRDGVNPRTNYVDIRAFGGMTPLLTAVCSPALTASAGPS